MAPPPSSPRYVRDRLTPGGSAFDPAIWGNEASGAAGYSYSNAGFTLLGAVLELAAGASLAQLAAERIFEPVACTL